MVKETEAHIVLVALLYACHNSSVVIVHLRLCSVKDHVFPVGHLTERRHAVEHFNVLIFLSLNLDSA